MKTTAQAWLDDWAKDDISGMYDLLTAVSQDAMTRDKFIARYTDVANNLTLQKIDSQILQALVLSPTLRAGRLPGELYDRHGRQFDPRYDHEPQPGKRKLEGSMG